MSGTYWRGAAEDEAMQDEHGFIWLAMLDTITDDLRATKVLDVGCNRGGFLRLLADRCAIAAGYGYDPAAAAVDDARTLAGGRPLTFEAAERLPPDWGSFDVAFSHEVLYLIRDLRGHATDVHRALRPGGSYFAVMGMHDRSPLMRRWHDERAQELGLPPLYSIDGVVSDFEAAGFVSAVANLRLGFVPTSAHRSNHSGDQSILDLLHYYARDKLLLRFTKPA